MNRTFFAVSAIFFLCSCHATPVPQCPTNSVCVLAEQHEALTKFSINNQAQKIYSIPPLMGLRTHTSTIEIRLFSDDDGYEKQTISLRTVIVPLHKTASSIPLVPGASFSLSVPADDLKRIYGLHDGCAEYVVSYRIAAQLTTDSYPFASVKPYKGQLCF